MPGRAAQAGAGGKAGNMKKEFNMEDIIPDQNAMNGGLEILQAYDQHVHGRQVNDVLEELGVKLGSAESAAWMTVVRNEIEPIKHMGSVIAAMGQVFLFGLWLGSRMERMGRGDRD
jgi:hypothetical protein